MQFIFVSFHKFTGGAYRNDPLVRLVYQIKFGVNRSALLKKDKDYFLLNIS